MIKLCEEINKLILLSNSSLKQYIIWLVFCLHVSINMYQLLFMFAMRLFGEMTIMKHFGSKAKHAEQRDVSCYVSCNTQTKTCNAPLFLQVPFQEPQKPTLFVVPH